MNLEIIHTDYEKAIITYQEAAYKYFEFLIKADPDGFGKFTVEDLSEVNWEVIDMLIEDMNNNGIDYGGKWKEAEDILHKAGCTLEDAKEIFIKDLRNFYPKIAGDYAGDIPPLLLV